MKEFIELRHTFKVSADVLYQAWLDSKMHSEMTGAVANCSPHIGGKFSAWDGYISGSNLSLIPNKEIIQKWRTTEFADSDDDSKLVVQFNQLQDGTELVLIHSGIPAGQTQYVKGWIDFYFLPMELYFG